MTQNEKTIRQMMRDLGRLRTYSTLCIIRRKAKGWSPDTDHVVVFVDRARIDRAEGCMPFVICEVGPEGRTLDEGIVIENGQTYIVDELREGYSTGPYTIEVVPNLHKSLDAIFNTLRGYTTS